MTAASASETPDTLTRFLAILIDGVVAGVLSSIPLIGGLGGILGAAYFVVRDGLELDVMNERSLGKHVMDLRVERLDGQSMDIEASVRRNWMWGIGTVSSAVASFPLFGPFFSIPLAVFGLAVGLYEAYRVLTREDGRRWGDELAETRVVKA
jgi:uncharacterized RDD family membrane protein YckC